MKPRVWKLRGIWLMTCGACMTAREFGAWPPALCCALRHRFSCEPVEVSA